MPPTTAAKASSLRRTALRCVAGDASGQLSQDVEFAALDAEETHLFLFRGHVEIVRCRAVRYPFISADRCFGYAHRTLRPNITNER